MPKAVVKARVKARKDLPTAEKQPRLGSHEALQRAESCANDMLLKSVVTRNAQASVAVARNSENDARTFWIFAGFAGRAGFDVLTRGKGQEHGLDVRVVMADSVKLFRHAWLSPRY